ncbi:hypothetical protein EDEG_00398 [Edhazardia aedis USNM 41457]|uniref:PCI domain-containing protein n=1 Tax=Edhazardia aedis (strain USNM 41457) TaxID=1003232 RepID=J9D1G9_EDHAE|nr:hypothetical protein EDEG_00398 [Edhazardia aedis USNM 41457]|eukprot:EJW01681.1 hypothetical protein EDEG_00398 [Edhazardia aedis USNM 41457]
MRRLIRKFMSNEILERSLCETVDCFNKYLKNYKAEFLKAIDNHNLRVVSKFFESIQLSDLQNILQCSVDECIDRVCEAVNKGDLNCKIDQIKGLVTFETQNDESNFEKIDIVLDKIMKISNMIDKENATL